MTTMMRWNLLTLGLLLTSMSYGQNVCGPKALQALHSAHQHDASLPRRGLPGLQGTGVDSHTSVGTPHWYSACTWTAQCHHQFGVWAFVPRRSQARRGACR